MSATENLLAVYSAKLPLKGATLLSLAARCGWHLRFLALGGYFCDNDDVSKTPLSKHVSLILVGCTDAHSSALAALDQSYRRLDRTSIPQLLKSGQLDWCEFYIGRFDYAAHLKRWPKQQPQLDGSVAPTDVSKVRAAKTRYILSNRSRRASGRDFIARIAEILASGTKGVVAKFVRPSR